MIDDGEFGLVLYHINHFRLFNAKTGLYIYYIYMICKHKSTICQSVGTVEYTDCISAER